MSRLLFLLALSISAFAQTTVINGWGGGGGSGATSVGLSMPSTLCSVSGSPVTTTGTLTCTYATGQTANLVFGTDGSGNVGLMNLASAQLPSPLPATKASVSHQFFTSYTSSTGLFTAAQPACADLSNAAASCSTDATNASNISAGTLGAGRMPNPSATTLGGIESLASASHQWINTISTSGVPSATQPACADLSNSAASCSTDATNAANISSGTVGTARLGSGTASSSTYLRGDQTWATVSGGTTVTAAAPYLSIGGTKYVAQTMWPYTAMFTGGTYLNANTTTITTGTNGSTLLLNSGTSDAWYSTTASASIEAEFAMASAATNTSTSGYIESGICLYDSTNSLLRCIYLLNAQVSQSGGGNLTRLQCKTDAYTGSGSPGTETTYTEDPIAGNFVHLKAYVSGSTYYLQYSLDGGQNYVTLQSGSVGTITKVVVRIAPLSALSVFSMVVS